MSDHDQKRPRAVIFACAGLRLTEEERAFFADADPLGFILFSNNIDEPAQLSDLTAALKDSIGRQDAPVLIDQEGGRVARLGPPHWRAAPAAARFAELYRVDPAAALEAVYLNARLMAAELTKLGITVDCAPVLDVPVRDAHDVIGDRALGEEPEAVAGLGQRMCEGLLAGGILPVLKHVPGHGRARADSHVELPVVDASLEELRKTDFHPFSALSAMPWAMTAHVLYRAIDASAPATTSTKVIAQAIRGEIGFEGVLLSDDISMEALEGSLGDRAGAVIAAGCDLALHCSGVIGEMAEVAEGPSPLGDASWARVERAEQRRGRPEPIDPESMTAQLDALLAGGGTA